MRLGFTLLELLVVISIVGILLAFTIPAIDPVRKGYAITNAADQLTGQLDLARQLAISENQRVEVRLYRTATNPSDGYNYSQLYRVDNNTPLGKGLLLPNNVEVLDDDTYSSLISLKNPLGGIQPKVGPYTNSNFKAIMFRPDGSTHLSPDGPLATDPWWTITVVLTSSRPSPGGPLPDNFATIALDPVTGRQTIYRP